MEQWALRFQEAERILADVVELVAERESVPASLPLELRRRTAEIRRKVAILETRMGLMQEDLSQLSNQQNMYILLRNFELILPPNCNFFSQLKSVLIQSRVHTAEA